MADLEKVCGLPTCGKPFVGHHRRLYCSDACSKNMIKLQLETLRQKRLASAKAKREQPVSCIICGKTVVPTNKFAPLSSLRYCSVACRKVGQERVLDRYRKTPKETSPSQQS